MTFFEDIPMDVLEEITAWLEAIDILRLQQCNKALQRRCNTRTIWRNAYRNMLQEHYLIQGLSLDGFSTLDLKHAALSPAAFHYKLKEKKASRFDYLRPERVSVLTSPTLQTFQFIELVPGGRFLLAFTQDSAQLWNLGKTARDHLPSHPVAQLMLNEDGHQLDSMMSPLIVNRGDTLIIVCVTTPSEDNSSWEGARLHCLTCSLDSGEIVHQGVTKLNDDRFHWPSWKHAYLTDAFFTMPLERNIFVWSLQDGKSITLADGVEEGLRFYLVIPCIDKRQNDPHLIGFTSEDIRVFKLPELADPGLDVEVPATPCLVNSTPDIPLYFFEDAGRKPLSSHNDRGINSFELFGSTTETKDEVKMRTLRFIINNPPIQSENGMFPVMPLCTETLGDISTILPERVLRTNSLTYHEFPGDSRVMFWRESDTLYCQFSRPTEDGRMESRKWRLWGWYCSPDSNSVFSVCPVSGRICILTDSELDDLEPEIRVMDFVPLIK